ncbi:MAG: xanthine dehydrogenase family protein subunit M [Candidatus Tectomicrobia bacterium]|uniref:Xanthine dehydrogenase family protein subunit M n=1 Tax=Tectimicrobiota bacterium TaxID=2528274 RepID=A0A932HZ80_UNCTE|nr:xanthine dehydrogenase family protein subunit M [Candidatus Tectomicrobia bacterium]
MDYVRASSVEEALQAAQAPGAAFVAGGTNLVPDILFGRRSAAVAVDISRLRELRFIEEREGRLRIGALTTVTDLLESELIRREAPPLCASAFEFAGPLVRNRATIGGNLLDASPAADLAPPLLAQDGEAELRSAQGGRRVLLQDFFLGYRKTAIRPGELLCAVSLRPLGPSGRSAYEKLQLRRAMAISVVSAAVALWMEGETCRQAGIGMGAVAPVPYRSAAAEAALRGRALGEAEIGVAAAAAREEARPIDDVRASAQYRKRMCEVLVRRLLRRAAGLPER